MQIDELNFRLGCGVFLGVALTIRGWNRWRHRGERAVLRVAATRERVLSLLCLGGFLCVGVYALSPWLDGAAWPLPHALRLSGGVLLMGALWLFTASHRALGRQWSPVLELRTDHQLVTHGPYRWVRHPMYSAFLLAALGFVLVSANGVIAIACLGGTVLMVGGRVLDEERMLMQTFGIAYAQYQARTGLLWPRLGTGFQP